MGDDVAIACRFPRDADLEPSVIRHLSELVNRVYDSAESGMWKATGVRTCPSQIGALLGAKELIFAENRGALVGCVQVKLIEPGVAEFGMLVADPARRGNGIGSALIVGYRPEFTEPLEKLYPELAPQLATACDFTVWHKRL